MQIFEWEQSVVTVARTWPTNGYLYEFMTFWSDYHKSIWMAVLILLICVFKFGFRKIAIPVLWATFSVVIADFVSRRIVKSYIMRPRPNFLDSMCDVSKCWGFVSSHSANVAAAGAFLILYRRKNAYWVLPIVVLVGFSRVYLIDHFPLDVIGGYILGLSIGVLIFKCYKKLHYKNKITFL